MTADGFGFMQLRMPDTIKTPCKCRVTITAELPDRLQNSVRWFPFIC